MNPEQCNCHECTQSRWKSSLAGQLESAFPKKEDSTELITVIVKILDGELPAMAANHCDAIALALDRHDSRIRDAERIAIISGDFTGKV